MLSMFIFCSIQPAPNPKSSALKSAINKDKDSTDGADNDVSNADGSSQKTLSPYLTPML